MSKVLSFSVFLIICSLTYAQQKGSTVIRCIDRGTLASLDKLTVDIFNDSICLSALTDTSGRVCFNQLFVGEYNVEVCTDTHLSNSELFIQPKQMLQHTVLIDTTRATNNSLEGQNHCYSKDGKSTDDLSSTSSIRVTSSTMLNFSSSNYVASQDMEEVCIIAYKSPLIMKDGGAQSRTINRNDIMKLPVRSAKGLATTVAGVNQDELGRMSFRGARSNANAYFVDGVKVRGAENLPKAFVDNVTVYSNGIPANYGDVTGGVISVKSKSIDMSALPMPYKYNQTSNNTSNSTDADQDYRFERMNYDHFLPIYENDFLSPLDHPHTTFGLDVDQAAWSYIKRRMSRGASIQRDAVKLEEMINAFRYKELNVPENEWVDVKTTRSDCRWNNEHELVTVHLRVRDYPSAQKRKPHNFVFLIDVSGSMSSNDKLPLVISGLKDLVKELNPEDRISIVTYAGNTGVPLPSTSCEDKSKILTALDNLHSGGGTNGMGGVQEAYRQAELNYDSTYNNRIILATDGDFNIGINNTGGLEKYISAKRGQGVYLTALGFGMGNYKNSTLETLAKRGDGNHFYIQSREEMKSVFADPGNLTNAIRDVKLDVEFNPRLISSYRLIGYESRLLKPQDFDDDTKDGGELGYGHNVTAVFEVEKGKSEAVESHFQKSRAKFGKQELAFVKLRYKPLEERESVERRYSLPENQVIESNPLLNLVIGLGLELRDSAFKGNLTKELLLEMVSDFKPSSKEEKELIQIVKAL
jgi:Ca-activated chloride channel family protein